MDQYDTHEQVAASAHMRFAVARTRARLRSCLVLPAGLALVACSLFAACGGDDTPAVDAPAGASEDAAQATAATAASAAASPTTTRANTSPTPQPATAANPLDEPCSLLTTDEVRSFIGDAQAPKATRAQGTSFCVWESVGSRTRVVNITIETNVAAWRRTINDTIGRGTGTPADVGEAAFVTAERITFVKGNFAVQVQVLVLPRPPSDALVALGKAIAARL